MSEEAQGYWQNGEWFYEMTVAYLDAPAAHIAKVRAQMRAELEREIARGQRIERVQDAANELWHSAAWSDLFGAFEADMGWGE